MIHPPQVRLEEPIAVTPHDGICGGESQQWLSYPTNPHVRFDERGRETGCCRMAQATAPVLASTMVWFPTAFLKLFVKEFKRLPQKEAISFSFPPLPPPRLGLIGLRKLLIQP